MHCKAVRQLLSKETSIIAMILAILLLLVCCDKQPGQYLLGTLCYGDGKDTVYSKVMKDPDFVVEEESFVGPYRNIREPGGTILYKINQTTFPVQLFMAVPSEYLFSGRKQPPESLHLIYINCGVFHLKEKRLSKEALDKYFFIYNHFTTILGKPVNEISNLQQHEFSSMDHKVLIAQWKNAGRLALLQFNLSQGEAYGCVYVSADRNNESRASGTMYGRVPDEIREKLKKQKDN